MKKIMLSSFIVLLLFIISCSLKDFEAPEFDKKIQIPLLNEIYYVEELADTTDDYMVYVGNDTMMFSISKDFDTEYVGEDDLMIDGQIEEFDTELGDELMIDSREESTTVEVGDDLTIDETEEIVERHLNNIEVEESGNAYTNIEILAFASEAINEPVEPINDEIIPPFYDFDPFNQNFTLFENDNFEYVVIDTGSVHISFFNNTELSLSSNLGEEFQMHFDFYTNGTAEEDNGTYLFTYYIDHVIGPGDTDLIDIPFNGRSVYATNYLKSYLTTDGSDGPIDVSENDSFEVSFYVGNMTILEANAVIEAASVEQVAGVSISDEEIQIISAEISSCTGSIVLENYLPFDIDTLRLEFEELFTPENNHFIILETGIIQDNTVTIPLDLANYTIHSESGTPIDSLSFQIYAVTDPPDGYSLVNQNDMISITISMEEMELNQFTGIIHQTTQNSSTIDISDEDIEIVSAEVAEGILDINFSGLSLTAPSSITISFDEIKEPVTNDPLEFIIDNFDNFQYNLAGHSIELAEDQLLHYQTTVTLDQEITISNTDIITADINIADLYFESVSGRFNSFEIEDEGAAEVDSTGEFNLFYAEINNCDLHIDINPENYSLPFGAAIELSFTDIYDPEDNPYTLNFRCPGDTIIDLSGFSLGNDPLSQTIIDSLYYSYIVTTDASDDEIMTIYADQQIEASIEIEEIVFQQVSGILDNREIELDDISEEIDMDDLPDSLSGLLEFQAVEMHMDLFNQTGFDCRLTMDITGSNDDGDLVSINVDEIIYAETTTNIVIIEGINEMLNIIPNQIEVTNLIAHVGNGITPGSITLNDSISGGYKVVTPMQFIVNDHYITKTIDGKELDNDDQDSINDYLSSAKLILEAENTLPFGAEISLYLANDSLEIFTNPLLVIDSLLVAPATIVDGGIIQPSENQIIVELSGDDFDVFLNYENPFVYPGIEIHILGSDGEIVTLMGNDNIHVVGLLEAEVHVVDTEE